MFKGLNVFDCAMFVLMVGSMLMAYLKGSQRLSPRARQWLQDVGEPAIRKMAEDAAAISGLTGDQRRLFVVELLRKTARETSGVDMPESIANYLVEHVYQKIKDRR